VLSGGLEDETPATPVERVLLPIPPCGIRRTTGLMGVLQRLGDLRDVFESVALGDRPISQQVP
jgi:hypothetical protein